MQYDKIWVIIQAESFKPVKSTIPLSNIEVYRKHVYWNIHWDHIYGPHYSLELKARSRDKHRKKV
jgi:hypothetical protein